MFIVIQINIQNIFEKMFLHDTVITTLFVILAFIDIMTIINKIMP